MTQRAFTLLELLVATAIIAVLAGLIFPALGRAKISSYNTAQTTALRNVGVAHSLYVEESGAYYHTKGLVATGMDAALLASPMDPIQNGAANLYRSFNDHEDWVSTYRDSTLTLADCVGESLFARVLDSPGGGWAIVQSEPPDSSDPRLIHFNATGMYAKRFIRLQFDGSVVHRPVVWRRQPNGQYMTSTLWYFTDNADLFEFPR